MSTITSLDFNDPLKVVQVQQAFELYLKETNNPLEIILANGRRFQEGDNQEYKWMGSQIAPMKWTVNGTVASVDDTTGTSVTFDSTTGLTAGMILFFKTDTGRDIDTVCAVASVTNGTAAVLVRISTANGIADNAVAEFTKGEDENKKSFTGQNSRQPDMYSNYFQIFDQVAELSNTVENSNMYGDPNFMKNQLTQTFYLYSQKMYNAISRGLGSKRGTILYGTTKSPGYMMGRQRQIDVAGGNLIDASMSAMNKSILNDAYQAIVENGGRPDTIVVNYEKARAISTFVSNGANPIIMMTPDQAKMSGEVVKMFQFDLPLSTGTISKIIIDDKIGNDKAYLVSLNKLAAVPFKNRSTRIIQGKENDLQDGSLAVVRGEYTAVVEDAKYSHAVIKNLS